MIRGDPGRSPLRHARLRGHAVLARPWITARFVDATIGRYDRVGSRVLIPSTSGPTSDVPKSTVVLVYTASMPCFGTAYFWSVSAEAADDAGSAVRERRSCRAELLHDLRRVVVRESGLREDVPSGRDDVLVAGLAVVEAVEAAADHGHALAEEVAIREEGERRVVDHREDVTVLDEILRRSEVCGARLVVDDLGLDLPTVDPAIGVLAVDASLKGLARVREHRARDARLREDEAELHRLGGDPRSGCGLCTARHRERCRTWRAGDSRSDQGAPEAQPRHVLHR